MGFWFFLGLLLAGVILLCMGHTAVGLALTIVGGAFILVCVLLVAIGLVALASEHPEVRRRR